MAVSVLLGWGDNSNYKLGLFDKRMNGKQVTRPSLIPAPRDLLSIAGGENYMFLVTVDRKVLCWGCNDFGQLGVGHFQDILDCMELVPFFQKYKLRKMCANYFHNLALLEGGIVASFGLNDHGQLGINSKENQCYPSLVQFEEEITEVAAGFSHSLALSVSGTVYAFGRNIEGQLGMGNKTSYLAPKKVDALKQETVKMISCGGSFSAALNDSGEVFCWGENDYGQLGLKDNRERLTPNKIRYFTKKNLFIILIQTGFDYSFALSKDHRFFAWGNNFKTRLGIGRSKFFVSIPTEVPLLPGAMVHLISTDTNHSLLLLKSGDVYTWGSGEHGQLGFGNTKDSSVPTILFSSNDKRYRVFNISAVTDSSFTLALQLSGWPYSLKSVHKFYDVKLVTDGDRCSNTCSSLPQIPDKSISSRSDLKGNAMDLPSLHLPPIILPSNSIAKAISMSIPTATNEQIPSTCITTSTSNSQNLNLFDDLQSSPSHYDPKRFYSTMYSTNVPPFLPNGATKSNPPTQSDSQSQIQYRHHPRFHSYNPSNLLSLPELSSPTNNKLLEQENKGKRKKEPSDNSEEIHHGDILPVRSAGDKKTNSKKRRK